MFVNMLTLEDLLIRIMAVSGVATHHAVSTQMLVHRMHAKPVPAHHKLGISRDIVAVYHSNMQILIR